MNTKQIDCVIELSHTLNFSRAAENLFISQPSLTYQIKSLEDEIGFKLFERSGKGATLTVAGEQFCQDIRKIQNELKDAIQRGQNISSTYKDSLNICIPMRSCMYNLPQIIKQFNKDMSDIALNISFIYDSSRIDDFLRGDYDILFAKESDLNRFSNIQCEFLYKSHFYIITKKDDPLASLDTVKEEDLNDRILMVGGGSPKEMVVVQNRIIKNTNVKTLNSPNHETTLLNIAADLGIVLAPGFANDHNNEFAWIPYDCREHINCVLAYHKDNKSKSISHFVNLAKEAYNDTKNILL